MHPQMPHHYLHDYGLYSGPHLSPHGVVQHPNQALALDGFDPSNYSQDPYSHQFDVSKSLGPFQYLQSPPQHAQSHPANASMNNFMYASYPQNAYPPSNGLKRQSASNDDAVSTSIPARQSAIDPRIPKFDRTYTDALEDELFDESSSTSAQSIRSHSHSSRNATPSFSFGRTPQYRNQNYVDKDPERPLGPQTNQPQQIQLRQPRIANQAKPIGSDMLYPHHSNPTFDLGARPDLNQLSTSAVAESIRRLRPPHPTTVSPREAFLDYPDNADFRERTLFKKSVSPLSQSHGVPDISIHQENEGTMSNDDDANTSDVLDSDTYRPISYSTPEKGTSRHLSTFPHSTRSTSASTQKSALGSAEASTENSSDSDSEYNPFKSSTKHRNNSGGRFPHSSKTYCCTDCGKRFDKIQPLQTHRRTAHGKGTGVSNLKYSNLSHRCDYVDPGTGRICNTVFSRPYDLVRHFETKHSPKRQDFICPHCEERKSFSRSDALRRHLRVKHPSYSRK